MPDPDPSKALLTAGTIAGLVEVEHVHQFNANAVRFTRSLGDLVGLKSIGLHLVRVEPGRDTTTFHNHQVDEEFLYILSGHALAEIGDDTFEVGPGDFMGFSANSLPHSMSNPFEEDLVYLMGGQRNQIDVCDYPRLKKRMYRVNGVKQSVAWDDLDSI